MTPNLIEEILESIGLEKIPMENEGIRILRDDSTFGKAGK